MNRETGKIISVSKSYPGSVHDMKVRVQGELITPDTIAIVDSGYQGLQKAHPKTLIPDKKPKKGELSKGQKTRNRKIARVRVAIEHVFGRIKRFGIMKFKYRNKRKKHNLRFNIIAGIVNLNLGF